MTTAGLNREATQFNQPGRTGYLLKMTTQELVQVLPARPDEQLTLFTETNRPITPRHLGSIEKFLTDTPDWAMNLIVHHAEAGHVPLDQQQEGPLGRRNSGGHLLGLRPEGMALMGR